MWEAISSLAWTAFAAVFLYKIWPLLNELLTREGTTIKVGSLELTVSQATGKIGKDVADIQDRLAKIESRLDGPANQTPAIFEEPEKSLDRSLLWVDDFPSNNAFLVEHLKERGIEVELSLSTEDALKRLRSRDFPAIITDLGRMEDGVDNPYAGLDLINAVRRQGKSVPILVFAGKRGLQNRRKLVEAGAENVTASGVEVNAFIDKYLLPRG